MNFQRLKTQGALSIQQLEGYIICLKDERDSIERKIEQYENALKWKRKFTD